MATGVNGVNGRYVTDRVKETSIERGHVQILSQNSMGTTVKGMLLRIKGVAILNVKVSSNYSAPIPTGFPGIRGKMNVLKRAGY